MLDALIGDNERPDDIAVLAIRFAAPVLDDLRLVLPSTQNGLIEMREVLRAVAHSGGASTPAWRPRRSSPSGRRVRMPSSTPSDPSQSSFRLRATLDDAGRMRIEVRDSGQWKPGAGSAERGLGLGLMRSFMDTVEVSPGERRHRRCDGASRRCAGRGLAASRSRVPRVHASALQRIGGPPSPRRVASRRGRRRDGQAAGRGRSPHRTDPARRPQRRDREQAARR